MVGTWGEDEQEEESAIITSRKGSTQRRIYPGLLLHMAFGFGIWCCGGEAWVLAWTGSIPFHFHSGWWLARQGIAYCRGYFMCFETHGIFVAKSTLS